MACPFIAAPTLHAEPSLNDAASAGVVYMGFPHNHWKLESTDLNLSVEKSLGSAFLKQLRRQALLIAARDELGLRTRDQLLLESQPEEGVEGVSVKIDDIKDFPTANPEYVDHRQFVAELERRSREVFPGELLKLGVEKNSPVKAEGDTTPDEAVVKLLHEYALIPQFEAVRHLHAEIREKGETLPRLASLVRAYTQLQIMTNYAVRDTHRVFQARAILYAQRVVAKFGETPETLSLRAAAWSLNNFPRIAREEFAAADPGKKVSEPWIDFARCYAAFDISGLDKAVEVHAENKDDLPLAKLLRFLLLVDTRNGVSLARPYGETIVAELPDCARLYQGMFAITTFDIPRTSDGENFVMHLGRRIPAQMRKVRGKTEPVAKATRALRNLVSPLWNPSVSELLTPSGINSRRSFSQADYYQKLGDLFTALNKADVKQDRGEPSLQALGALMLDEEFLTVLLMAKYLSGHNASPESVFLLSRPAVQTHPLADHLGTVARDEKFAAEWKDKIKDAKIPYETLSLVSDGVSKMERPWIDARIIRPYVLACRFADRENVRDMIWHHLRASRRKPQDKLFTVDRLMELCPENPYAVSEWMLRQENFDAEEAGKLLEKFEAYPNFRETMTNFYRKNNQESDATALMRLDFRENPRFALAIDLAIHDMQRGEFDRAIETLKYFLDSPAADVALDRAWAMLRIGMILHEIGRSEEARPYYNHAAQTHSAWGLSHMAQYLETMGEYDASERLVYAAQQAYPKSKPPSLWWGACYRMDRENLEKATEACEQFMIKNPKDERIRLPYIYYCLGRSEGGESDKNHFVNIFLETGNAVTGFISYCEALERGDDRWAGASLKMLRDEHERVGDDDWEHLAGKSGVHMERRRNGQHEPYMVIAAMLEADRLGGEPGNLNQEELEYLLGQSYKHAFENGRIVWLLYVLGRYYEACGKSEKAIDCYRRVLAMRVNNDVFPRSFSIKQLRELGTTKEEILRLTATDPGLPRRRVSMEMKDVLARQLFRDYSDSPSTALLKMEPGEDSPKPSADSTAPGELQEGLYRTTEIRFRGHSFMKPDTSVHWHLVKNGDWRTTGTAKAGALKTDRKPPRADGLQALTFGENEAVPALAGYFGDRVVLVISLAPGVSPDDLEPDVDSPFVRVEMEKLK